MSKGTKIALIVGIVVVAAIAITSVLLLTSDVYKRKRMTMEELEELCDQECEELHLSESEVEPVTRQCLCNNPGGETVIIWEAQGPTELGTK